MFLDDEIHIKKQRHVTLIIITIILTIAAIVLITIALILLKNNKNKFQSYFMS